MATRSAKTHRTLDPVIIRDLFGREWEVREERPTQHGFSLLLGKLLPVGRGALAAIPTMELYTFWADRPLARDGSSYDLPISGTTVKLLRRQFGFDYYAASQEWWLERLDDLATLSGVDFARRHNVADSIVSTMHSKFFGRRIRPIGWWHAPETKAVLTSGQSESVISRILGLPLGTVRKVRWLLTRDQAG